MVDAAPPVTAPPPPTVTTIAASRIDGIARTPKGHYVVATPEGVFDWEPGATPQRRATFPAGSFVMLDPEGTRFVVGHANGKSPLALELWDSETFTAIGPMKGSPAWKDNEDAANHSVSFSRDHGHLLYLGCGPLDDAGNSTNCETCVYTLAKGDQVHCTKTAPLVRCMPNPPAAIGKGMMVVVGNSHVSPEARAFVDDLLSASGKVAGIDDEQLIDAVTAVSGSGPAYIFHFIECLTAAGESAGLPSDTAKLLAMQTVYGAAALAAESDEEPGRLREQVTSPNGTTAAALSVLMGEDRLKKLVGEAVEAARKRSVELGK